MLARIKNKWVRRPLLVVLSPAMLVVYVALYSTIGFFAGAVEWARDVKSAW